MDAHDSSNTRGRDQWNAKAEFWDRLHGDEGNSFHRAIVEPAVERLLQLRAGERVLDAACGNGAMARRLAAWGAEVTAFDFSTSLVDLARSRGTPVGGPIRFLVADATDESAVASLGEGTFDAVVCTMALMDMPAISPLYRGVHRLLRAGGRFVFVTGHPVFDTANPIRVVQEEDRDGCISRRHTLELARYLDVPPTRVVGALGEPTPHDFHHRPLHVLLGEAFACGFVLEALEEPAFPRPARGEDSKRAWWQFPPALAGRLRKLAPKDVSALTGPP